ncbi:hypothetical protein LCGC14_3056290, partial [marine sediment metagenome]
ISSNSTTYWAALCLWLKIIKTIKKYLPKDQKVYQDKRCRKLTPLEYERIQTLPDNYTQGVADTHRYNGCGDGWTVDVIVHILKVISLNLNKESQDD